MIHMRVKNHQRAKTWYNKLQYLKKSKPIRIQLLATALYKFCTRIISSILVFLVWVPLINNRVFFWTGLTMDLDHCRESLVIPGRRGLLLHHSLLYFQWFIYSWQPLFCGKDSILIFFPLMSNQSIELRTSKKSSLGKFHTPSHLSQSCHFI